MKIAPIPSLVCISLFALIFQMPASAALEANIETGISGKTVATFYIKERITAADAKEISVTVKQFDAKFQNNWAIHVQLDSVGGDMYAAMDIGRILRAKEATAIIERGAKCLSACVYVLAGAPYRIVYQNSSVGIHRPYDPSDKADTPAQQKEKQARLANDLLAYLQQMNIPTRLYEDAQYISPDRMKILSTEQLQIYGLNANDPASDEASEVAFAKKLGISRLELGTRRSAARSLCGLDRLSASSTAEQVRAAVRCESDYVKAGPKQ